MEQRESEKKKITIVGRADKPFYHAPSIRGGRPLGSYGTTLPQERTWHRQVEVSVYTAVGQEPLGLSATREKMPSMRLSGIVSLGHTSSFAACLNFSHCHFDTMPSVPRLAQSALDCLFGAFLRKTHVDSSPCQPSCR